MGVVAKLIIIFAAIALVHLRVPTASGIISLDNNGYKGIVVAVRSTISEDPALVDNIKELFSKASKFLHTATRGHTFYEEITIALPFTWRSNRSYETVLSDYFSSAHVRIDIPNPEYDDSPYTLQTGSCGEPGQYIHLTPGFVKGIHDQEMLEKFGPPERQLVHEWAHLRYGVFDEYGTPGDPRFPTFYQDSGRIRPTSCIKDIKGWVEGKDGGPCYIMEGGYIDKNCIFVPDMHQQNVTASIMYMPYILSMDGFCDRTANKFHNVRAPTRQNALCHYESTWSVISKHDDFNESKRRKRQASYQEPRFRIVRHGSNDETRIVLVLDVSGSMSGKPMELLHQAAVRFVADKVPDGSHLGIVQFSTFARIRHNLTQVTPQTRKGLVDSLPSKDDEGTTAIGKGMLKGLEVLQNHSRESVEGGMIILITDGEENVSPLINEVLPEVVKAKVVVNTVAFGSDASLKLENVTKATGGKGFFFKDLHGTRPTSDLDAAFLESITSQADIDLQPVKLTDNDRLTIPAYDALTTTVYIDKELGKNTVFTILSSSIRETEASIKEPSEKRYDSSSPRYNKDTGTRNRIQFSIPEAESGFWEVVVHNRRHLPMQVSLSVTSEPKDVREQPVRVRSWISDFQLKFPAYAKVYAEVKKGYSAVIGAKVTATVDRPIGGTVDIQLKDNGAGADVVQNDGVYSAYFTQFNGNGRYAVVANVENDGGAKLKRGVRASGSVAIPKYPKKIAEMKSKKSPTDSFPLEDFVYRKEPLDEEDEGEPLKEPIVRSSDTGAFRVENWTNTKVIVPPGNITDLVVVSSHDAESKYVTLRWTSPGAGLDNGNVSSIELRADHQPEALLLFFNESFLFNETWVSNGTLEPLPAGEVQTVTVGLPDFFFPNRSDSEVIAIYFAVRALDKSENISPSYNLAIANFGVEKLVGIRIKTKDDKQDKPFRWWPAVLGIGLAVLLLIILLIILVVMFHRKRNTRGMVRVYSD